MGYGFPAAIGAQVAFPDGMVIDIAGDGSIQMNIQELATAVQYELPVKVAILNNGFLGMVRQWQQLFYERRYSSTPMFAGFCETGRGLRRLGITCGKRAEVEPVIREALHTRSRSSWTSGWPRENASIPWCRQARL